MYSLPQWCRRVTAAARAEPGRRAIATGRSPSALSLPRGRGARRPVVRTFAECWGYQVTAGGDLDGAGRADLVVSGLPIDSAGYRSGQYRMFQGEGLTPFSTVSLDDADGAWSSDDDAVPKLVGGGDFDGDGRADLVYRYLGAPAVLLGW